MSTLTIDTTPRTATMSAYVARSYGSPEVLHLESIAVPQIKPDEVLVQVEAAAIDRGTHHVLSGEIYPVRLAFGLRRPRNPVPGLDLAGTVVATGNKVTQFKVGDAVFGIGRGSLAPFAPAPESKLAHKPGNLPWEQAAILPISGLTALQAIRDAARVQPGHSVLILGASAGVGSFAVQIANAYGGAVTAVCRASKVDYVRSLGADTVLDYASIDPCSGDQQYDVILDIGGNRTSRHMKRALAPDGTLVFVGGALENKWTGGQFRPMRAALGSRFGKQRMVWFISKETNADLPELLDLITTGKLIPPLDSIAPYADLPAALTRMTTGDIRGKIAIRL